MSVKAYRECSKTNFGRVNTAGLAISLPRGTRSGRPPENHNWL